jgi:hypothetical protein
VTPATIAMVMALMLHATVVPARAAQLVPITVAISLVNRGRTPQTLEFPTADLFSVEVRDTSGKVIFDSLSGHKPIDVHRKLFVPIGTTRVAAFVWNGLSNEMRALAPGSYDVRVEMQSTSADLVADLPLTIDAPVPILSAIESNTKAETTVVGQPSRENGVIYLQDSTGKIALSRALGLHPQGDFVVRGTPTDMLGRRTLVIDRFAPAANNLAPEATPTPPPSPSPTPPIPRRSG